MVSVKVTVFGANGGIGKHVVSQLLAARHIVAAVVRSGRAGEVPGAHLTEVPSLNDHELLVQVIAGADAVISTIGPRQSSDGPVASLATAAILRAMVEAGSSRIIAISATPVAETANTDGPVLRYLLVPLIRSLLAEHYLDLARMEGMMAGTRLHWTAIRPPRLTNGPLTGRYRTRMDANVPNGFRISRADAAHAMIAAATDPSTSGHAVSCAY